MVRSLRKASSSGVPILIKSGMRLSSVYSSARKLTKSIQKVPTFMVAVSRCLLFSGFFRTTPTPCVFSPISLRYLLRCSANSRPSISSSAMSMSTGACCWKRSKSFFPFFFVLPPPITFDPWRPAEGTVFASNEDDTDNDSDEGALYLEVNLWGVRLVGRVTRSGPNRQNSGVAKSLSRTHPPATRRVVESFPSSLALRSNLNSSRSSGERLM
mmetsp:Transcript_12581/g.26459  ORF Transcript_12581/g.26459 Transcript_12581/m.26459 type:complete len:213 (-) Transcript_12581:1153-1791(-)